MRQVIVFFCFFASSISLDIKCSWGCWDKQAKSPLNCVHVLVENVQSPHDFQYLYVCQFVLKTWNHAPGWAKRNLAQVLPDQELDYMCLIHSVKQNDSNG